MFEVQNIFLEGPDCAGKSTLYNEIHNATNYRWNIQDRSYLSMICYARQACKPKNIIQKLRKQFEREIANLNNVYVIIMPSLCIVRQRLEKRGDPIQNLDTIDELYQIFKEEVGLIQGLPNVYIFSSGASQKTASYVVSILLKREAFSLRTIGTNITQFVMFSGKDEHEINFNISGRLSDKLDETILLNPREGDYYKEIYIDTCHIIEKEKMGLNPYFKPQDDSSRRYYYSSNSCISSVHFMPRNDELKCFVVFRSLDAVLNASIDLDFIGFLVNKIGTQFFKKCKTYDLTVRMNSAHIKHDN